MFQLLTSATLLEPAQRLAVTKDEKKKFRDLLAKNQIKEVKPFTKFYRWYQPKNFKRSVNLVYKGVQQGYLMGNEVAELDADVRVLYECFGLFHASEYSRIAEKLYLKQF